MQQPNGQTVVSFCIIALLTFKLDVLYLSVCISHIQHFEILKIISLFVQPCKQKKSRLSDEVFFFPTGATIHCGFVRGLEL